MGGGKGNYERIWCPDGCASNSSSDVPPMTFPEWMVWYERAGYRLTSSDVNMMNGVRDLGVRVDRLWWTGERYANTIAEANGGMTGGERRDMVEVCKNAAGLVGFFNITDRSRRFEEYVSLRRPLTWYLVRVDLCTFLSGIIVSC